MKNAVLIGAGSLVALALLSSLTPKGPEPLSGVEYARMAKAGTLKEPEIYARPTPQVGEPQQDEDILVKARRSQAIWPHDKPVREMSVQEVVELMAYYQWLPERRQQEIQNLPDKRKLEIQKYLDNLQ